jgi:predicted GTPase
MKLGDQRIESKMGRSKAEPIRHCVCDAVVIATPMDLRRKIRIDQPAVRVSYDFDIDLTSLIDRFLNKMV